MGPATVPCSVPEEGNTWDWGLSMSHMHSVSIWMPFIPRAELKGKDTGLQGGQTLTCALQQPVAGPSPPVTSVTKPFYIYKALKSADSRENVSIGHIVTSPSSVPQTLYPPAFPPVPDLKLLMSWQV